MDEIFADVEDLTEAEVVALDALADGSSGDADIEDAFIKALLLSLRVFKERQKKYGRKNIARGGASGVLMRLGDKQSRLEQHYQAGRGSEVKDESVEDTWIDQVNYGGIGFMVHRGWWPGASDK